MTDATAAAREAFAGLKERIAAPDEGALALLFGEARTVNGWLDREMPDDLLRRIFDLARMGPTSGNCSPARFVFVRSPVARVVRLYREEGLRVRRRGDRKGAVGTRAPLDRPDTAARRKNNLRPASSYDWR